MKKVRLSYLRWTVLAVLLSFVWFASISSKIGEEYAIYIYPWVSKFLSAISSWTSFSWDEWVVVGSIIGLLSFPFYMRLKQKAGWLRIVRGEIEMVLWIYVWFYWGWGMNYYRASFFQRADVKPAVYEEERFTQFLQEYTQDLNQAYRDCRQFDWMKSPDLFRPMLEVDADAALESDAVPDSCALPYRVSWVQNEIKECYRNIPAQYGLCQPQSYQHPKRSSFNGLYSNVGVLGFMGPFFAESHVNHELSVIEYPFTYAHELSHLLGVSSEAEANLWAFTVCSQSDDPLIRLSGYLGLLSYVRSNAYYLLGPIKFEEWESELLPEIKAAFHRIHAYWRLRYNVTLGEMQSAVYTFYLKRNKISSGQKNYAQVIGMLLSLPDFKIPTRYPGDAEKDDSDAI